MTTGCESGRMMTAEGTDSDGYILKSIRLNIHLDNVEKRRSHSEATEKYFEKKEEEKLSNSSNVGRGEIKQFEPTSENTKKFMFDWVREAKTPDVTIEALVDNGEALGLISTRLSESDRKDYGALFIGLVEGAGTDKFGKGGIAKGVGKRLIAHAVRKADKADVDAIYLKAVTTAIPYYKNLGFKSVGAYWILEGAEFNNMKEE